jgi:hypothetical protein
LTTEGEAEAVLAPRTQNPLLWTRRLGGREEKLFVAEEVLLLRLSSLCGPGTLLQPLPAHKMLR